jgi:hypothetical protein
MEKAGYADKVGGLYEDRWGLRLLMDLLSGEFESLEREPVGDDEPGVDLWGNRTDGIRECFQCKAENGDKPAWSIADLRRVTVLSHLRQQLDRDPKRHRFCFVSSTPAPDFDHLCRSARDSRDARSFFDGQVQASQKRSNAFATFCAAVGLSPDSEVDLEHARDLLSRSRFYQFQSSEDQWRDLQARMRGFVGGDPELALRTLGDWLREQLRKPITLPGIKAFLESKGFRLAFSAESIAAVLGTLQQRFFHSIKYDLAGGRLIQRAETGQVLDLLDESTGRVVVVHGVAGVGKSGVLYEVASELQKRGTPFLPLRLDRIELKGSPQRLGAGLGLSKSPAKCLEMFSSGQHSVLLLDQMDALRWTSAHSSEGWDVCRELIGETLSTEQGRVVVCCRTFDLENDPQLRGWENETKNLRRVEVRDLSEKDVKNAIAQVCEGRQEPPILRVKEIELLMRVQHLQMWLEIYASTQEVPRFDTALALMEKFWANRMDEMERAGISPRRAEELLDNLVKAMDDGARFSAPVLRLKATEKELKALQSLHLVQIEPSRQMVSFCHQSYLDYRVARSVQAELGDGQQTVAEWLGPKPAQSLFRREQLRLLLGVLRESEDETYLPALGVLLRTDDRVRFHLRQLVLQFLGQLTNLREQEVQLALELVDQPFWRNHVIADVIGGSSAWFEVFDDQGRIEEWLASADPYLRDAALNIIRWASRKSGDRVAGLLSAYFGRDSEWTGRIAGSLPFDPAEDSSGLFELRLKLVRDGSYVGEHVSWKRLGQADPARLFQLVSELLIALAERIAVPEPKSQPGRRGQIKFRDLDAADIVPVPGDPGDILFSGWELLVRSMALVLAASRPDFEDRYTLDAHVHDFDDLEPVCRLLRKVGGELLRRDWERFVDLAGRTVREIPRIQLLLLDSLRSGPAIPDLGDWALGWISAEPWRARLRFRYRDSPWQIAGEVVELFAPVCSYDSYVRFEEYLLDFIEPDFKQGLRYRHVLLSESKHFLSRPSSAGATQYHLIPRLPAERRSERLRRRFLESQRKYKDVDEVFFAGASRSQSGWVRSPDSVRDNRNRLSDRSWLSIINSKRLREKKSRWGRMGEHGYLERTSVGTLSSDLRSATARDLERFARLALKIPIGAPSAFLHAIVSGLKTDSPPDDLTQEEKGKWQPVSYEALEAVCRLLIARGEVTMEEAEPAKEVCWLLENHVGYSWAADIVDLLVWIAIEHCDPRSNDSWPDLESEALNVTRGAAAHALRAFLFAHPHRLSEVRGAMDRLVRDPHPAVRVAAIAACLPVFNIDRKQAIEWFLTSCTTPDAVLATRSADEFLQYTLHEEVEELRGVVERMLASDQEAVAETAARRVTAAYLCEEVLPDLYMMCREGRPALRRGVAKVAAGLLGEARFAERAKDALLRLADDDDPTVAREVAQGFGELDMNRMQEDRNAWTTFARSKAFQAEPSPLLWALREQSGNLLPFSECLLAVGESFAEAARFAGISHELVPLLLRLYEQAKHDVEIHQRCLDLWDRLLERRVGDAVSLTEELDRV